MNTLKVQIEAVAPHANLTPRAISLLQSFFLEQSTAEEEDELASWMSATPANNALFDLLIDLNEYGPGAATTYILRKFSKKPPVTKRKRIMRVLGIIGYVFGGLLLLGLIDSYMKTGVLYWISTGKKPGRPATEIYVSAGTSPKTFWLPDSTRVELYPNSSLVYPNRFIWSKEVQLKGSARFDIRSTLEGSLHVILGDRRSVEQEYGPLIVITDSTGKTVVQGVDQ